MTTVTDQVREIEAKCLLQVYRRLPIVLVRGDGSQVFDAEGRAYLDLLSGLGVTSLGHAHPGLADALAAQARVLVHTSNLYFHPLQGQVANRLARLSGLPRTFFCNSGTEAVEACLKFARRYWHSKGETRTQIVAFDRSFHGRTFGSLSVTSDLHYRTPFEPLVPGVTFVSPMDPDALRTAVTPETAAIILEPIQGEGGVRPIPQATADAVQALCAKTGTLLIADEVQCGLGRTGRPFFAPALGLRPDLMALGKALGAGFPLGAALLSQAVAQTVEFGDHGSTYGGNLLACRAALVFLDALEGGLLERVQAAGKRFEDGLRSLAEVHSVIGDIRGAGLIWGLDVEQTAAERMVEAATKCGLLINRTDGTVIRLLPPLTITDAEIDDALVRLDDAFRGATEPGTTGE